MTEVNADSMDIIGNIKDPVVQTSFDAYSDLDRMSAKHNKHMTLLANVYEFWTHKTILLIISFVLVLIYLTTRYFLVENNSEIVKLINSDSTKAITYYVTAVSAWFVTKNLEK